MMYVITRCSAPRCRTTENCTFDDLADSYFDILVELERQGWVVKDWLCDSRDVPLTCPACASGQGTQTVSGFISDLLQNHTPTRICAIQDKFVSVFYGALRLDITPRRARLFDDLFDDVPLHEEVGSFLADALKHCRHKAALVDLNPGHKNALLRILSLDSTELVE